MNMQDAYEMGVKLAMQEAGLIKEANRFGKYLAEIASGGRSAGPLTKQLGVRGVTPQLLDQLPSYFARVGSSKGGIVGDRVSKMRSLMAKAIPDYPLKGAREATNIERHVNKARKALARPDKII